MQRILSKSLFLLVTTLFQFWKNRRAIFVFFVLLVFPILGLKCASLYFFGQEAYDGFWKHVVISLEWLVLPIRQGAVFWLIYMGSNNEKVSEIQCLKRGFDRWAPFLIVAFITNAAVSLGIAVMVVPGVVIWILFMFSKLFVITRNMQPIAAIKESFALARPNFFPIFGVIFPNAFIILGLFIIINKGLVLFLHDPEWKIFNMFIAGILGYVLNSLAVIFVYPLYTELKHRRLEEPTVTLE